MKQEDKDFSQIRKKNFKKFYTEIQKSDSLYNDEGCMYSAIPEEFYEAGFNKALEIVKQRINSSLFIDIVSEALHSVYFFGDVDLKKLNISEDKDDPKYYGYFKRRSKELRKDILKELLKI